MIPICLVTGFLGSGKTTLLRRLHRRMQGRRLVYLVNEFAPVDVDGRALNLPENKLVAVTGGSIFCRCLVSRLLKVLRDIAARPDAAEGIIAEASGMADPRVFARLLQEADLEAHFRLARVVTVIDPVTLPKLLRTLPNVRAQIAAADLVLLNKCDRADDEARLRAAAAVAELNPGAELRHTQWAETEFDPFPETPRQEIDGPYAACRDPNFATVSLPLAPDTDWPKLRKAVGELSPDLYRAKGFVPAGVHGLQHVEWTLASPDWQSEAAPAGARPVLVLIVKGSAEPRAKELATAVADGRFAAGVNT